MVSSICHISERWPQIVPGRFHQNHGKLSELGVTVCLSERNVGPKVKFMFHLLFLITVVLLQPVYARFDYNQIELEEKVAVIHNRTEIACPLLPPDGITHGSLPLSHDYAALEDLVTLVFWYKGLNSQVPFITIDIRNMPRMSSANSAISYSTLLSQLSVEQTTRLSDIRGRLKAQQSQQDTGHSPTESKNVSSSWPSIPTLFLPESDITQSFAQRTTVKIDLYSRVAFLLIEDVQLDDEGIYRCRVDFRWSRTTNKFYQLQLIVPPKKLFIYEQDGKLILNGIAGPYQEESENVELICETKQAKPSPRVYWYENSVLIDDSYELVLGSSDSSPWSTSSKSNTTSQNNVLSPSQILDSYVHKSFVRARNRLVLAGPLRRKDLHREFRCIALNSDLIQPTEVSVRLNMLLRPINVEIILGPKDSFVSGQDVRILCRSYGSRPVAQLTWYRDGKKVVHNVENHFDQAHNLSTSVVRFVPKAEDHRSELTCEATNIRLPEDQAIRDSVRINIQYLPKVELVRIYPPPSENILPENSTVRLLCSAQANPAPTEPVVWYFNNSKLESNQGTTLFVQNEALVIDRLSWKWHHGQYSCLVTNSQGRSMSNQLFLTVSYTPRCRSMKTQVYGIGVNETVNILCDVDAQPPTVYFNWLYNGTPASYLRYSSRGSQSVLQFTPRDRYDYGLVSCLAQNSVGKMHKPCLYSVIPYGKPDPVKSCTVLQGNRELGQTMVKCKFPFNGGIDTRCQLQVQRTNDSQLIWKGNDYPNMSNQIDSCVFYPLNLALSKTYKMSVTSFNEMGAAPPYTFYSTLSDSSLSWRKTEHSSQLNDSTETQADSLLKQSYLSNQISHLWSRLVSDGDWIFVLVLLVLGVLLVSLVITIGSIRQMYIEQEVNLSSVEKFSPIDQVNEAHIDPDDEQMHFPDDSLEMDPIQHVCVNNHHSQRIEYKLTNEDNFFMGDSLANPTEI